MSGAFLHLHISLEWSTKMTDYTGEKNAIIILITLIWWVKSLNFSVFPFRFEFVNFIGIYDFAEKKSNNRLFPIFLPPNPGVVFFLCLFFVVVFFFSMNCEYHKPTSFHLCIDKIIFLDIHVCSLSYQTLEKNRSSFTVTVIATCPVQ